MKTIVIYESMYGNTHAVAEQIASGLEAAGPVTVTAPESLTAAEVAEYDLIVVGGPTHMHGMSSAGSRRAASETAQKDPNLDLDDAASGPGLRRWLDALPKATGASVATFDTRLDRPAIVTGSAAKGIARGLRRRGFKTISDPESFFVADSEGPLLDGETERARQWGEKLASRVTSESA